MLLSKYPHLLLSSNPNCLHSINENYGRVFFLSNTNSILCSESPNLPKSCGHALPVKAGNSPQPKDILCSWKLASTNGMSDTYKSRATNSAIEGLTGNDISVIANTDSIPSSEGDSTGSLGRLKAEKVKALVRKRYSQLKQENREENGELVMEQEPPEVHFNPTSKQKPIGDKGTERSSASAKKSAKAYQSNRNAVLTQSKVHSGDIGLQNIQNTQKKSATTSDVSARVVDARDSDSHLRGWGNGRSVDMVRYRTPEISKGRGKGFANSDFFSRKSFKDIGCSEYIIESLKKQTFPRPSHIQAMAFKPVVNGKSCIIADQSGSGKTLAYLLPVIQLLRQQELDSQIEPASQAPRVVILAPTAELASQVLNNCRAMSRSGVPFKSIVVTGGFRQRTQLESLEQGVDVLIATPGRFLYLIKEGFLQLTNLRCAVLDEVDILFSNEDSEAALKCLISSSPVTAQYLFVTATLPGDIYNKIIGIFPDCQVIMGPGMHRISTGLEEVLVDCSGDDGTEKNLDTAFLNKKSALLQLLEANRVEKTIVFCNRIETCRKVENILKRTDRKGKLVQVLPFHAAVTQEQRISNMEKFKHSQSDGTSQFLVCTDRASRGIDFVGVDHVILFDFPRDPSEYVRRVGRTARGAGGKGKAFIFVIGKQVSLATKIVERNKKGHPLHDVPSAYELMK